MRLLRSTRGRLVALQVTILAVACSATALAFYGFASVPRQNEVDGTLYGQWTAISDGLAVQNGSVVYAPGSLPETYGVQQVPVEAELYTRHGLMAQTTSHVMTDAQVRAVAEQVLRTGASTGRAVDTAGPSGSPRRLYADLEQLGTEPVVIVVSRSTAELDAYLRSLVAVLAAGSAAVVLLGGVLAWLVVGRTLRPVRELTSAARSIGDRDLGRRVDVATPDDELGELKATFNEMLARLEGSFDGLRRFTADASHELRSPLTLIRTEVEVALTRARDREDYERVLRGVRSEVEHLGRITDQLLLLAQADAGTLTPRLTDVDVADFVEEEAARWRAVADASGVRLAARAPESGTARADPDLLRRVVDNLLDNAIRYSPRLTTVTLGAERTPGGGWLVQVADEGPGVPAELRDRIFERFARADTVRTRRSAGAGLGLALSAAVARAHGGSLELMPGDGAGAVFVLRLPG